MKETSIKKINLGKRLNEIEQFNQTVSYSPLKDPIMDLLKRGISVKTANMLVKLEDNILNRTSSLYRRSKKEKQELSETNIELNEMAMTDPLTGFYNRRYLFGQNATETKRKEIGILEKEFDRAKRYGHDLIVAIVDFDQFKNFNDTYGHTEGDKLIETFAKAVNEILRKEDIKVRVGGDEFCLIFPEINIDQAKIVIERIRAKYIDIQDINFKNTPKQSLSVGLSSLLSSEPETYNDLIGFADKAVYEAKKARENKTIVFNPIK